MMQMIKTNFIIYHNNNIFFVVYIWENSKEMNLQKITLQEASLGEIYQHVLVKQKTSLPLHFLESL